MSNYNSTGLRSNPEAPSESRYYPEDTYYCEMCDKRISEEQSKFSLCRACEAKTRREISDFLNALTVEQLEYFDWLTDGTAPSELLEKETRNEHNVAMRERTEDKPYA